MVRPDPAAVLRHLRRSRWSARPTVRRSTSPRPRASWSAASTPSTPRSSSRSSSSPSTSTWSPSRRWPPRCSSAAGTRRSGSTGSGPAPTRATSPVIWFFGKVLAFVFFFIWLRGSLPRMRYDQFMKLGWKYLIPISLAWIIAVATLRVAKTRGLVRQRRRADRHRVALVGPPRAVLLRRVRRDRRPSPRRGRPAASRWLPDAADARRWPGPRCRRTAHLRHLYPVSTWQGRTPDGRRSPSRSRSRSSSWTRSPGSESPSGRCSARSSPSSTPTRASTPPTAPRFHGRHQLNRWPDGLEKCIGCELCAWACPADAIYVEGASNYDASRRRAVQPRRALRPRLPDQLPALHPVRAVHRGLPDAGAHDDQRVRAGRQQPRRPDLREVRPPRPAAAWHGAAAARRCAG